MKTILLEVADESYQTILAFIQLLPENKCRLLNDDTLLSDNETLHIAKSITQIQQGDYSEFEEWDTVKARL